MNMKMTKLPVFVIVVERMFVASFINFAYYFSLKDLGDSRTYMRINRYLVKKNVDVSICFPHSAESGVEKSGPPVRGYF